ncbi:hypothetical protein Tco_1005325 [Tanacetum coccineum]|uniref:Uncharacterized protein n=1 Tax=Tanacetum coccineum TaxID=301880 RepID=A0ABQ5FGW0_9ASTR
MHDAEKNDAERAEEEKDAGKEITRDEQVEDDQVRALINVTHKDKSEFVLLTSSQSLSSNYHTEINSLLDVQIQKEIPTVLSALLLDVLVRFLDSRSREVGETQILVSVIPEQPTPPTPTPLTTPLPAPPIISETPPVTTTVPDPLLAVIQRLTDLERKFEAWTKVDHSKAIEASVQANVINEVKNRLPKVFTDIVEPRMESTV